MQTGNRTGTATDYAQREARKLAESFREMREHVGLMRVDAVWYADERNESSRHWQVPMFEADSTDIRAAALLAEESVREQISEREPGAYEFEFSTRKGNCVRAATVELTEGKFNWFPALMLFRTQGWVHDAEIVEWLRDWNTPDFNVKSKAMRWNKAKGSDGRFIAGGKYPGLPVLKRPFWEMQCYSADLHDAEIKNSLLRTLQLGGALVDVFNRSVPCQYWHWFSQEYSCCPFEWDSRFKWTSDSYPTLFINFVNLLSDVASFPMLQNERRSVSWAVINNRLEQNGAPLFPGQWVQTHFAGELGVPRFFSNGNPQVQREWPDFLRVCELACEWLVEHWETGCGGPDELGLDHINDEWIVLKNRRTEEDGLMMVVKVHCEDGADYDAGVALAGETICFGGLYYDVKTLEEQRLILRKGRKTEFVKCKAAVGNSIQIGDVFETAVEDAERLVEAGLCEWVPSNGKPLPQGVEFTEVDPKANWKTRFEEPLETPVGMFPADLYQRIGCSDTTLRKTAQRLGVVTPSVGENNFRYRDADCLQICHEFAASKNRKHSSGATALIAELEAAMKTSKPKARK